MLLCSELEGQRRASREHLIFGPFNLYFDCSTRVLTVWLMFRPFSMFGLFQLQMTFLIVLWCFGLHFKFWLGLWSFDLRFDVLACALTFWLALWYFCLRFDILAPALMFHFALSSLDRILNIRKWFVRESPRKWSCH